MGYKGNCTGLPSLLNLFLATGEHFPYSLLHNKYLPHLYRNIQSFKQT